MSLLAQCKKLCERIRVMVLNVINAFLPSRIQDVADAIKESNKTLRILRNKLKKSRNLNEKRGITSCIAQLKGYKLRLMRLKRKDGRKDGRKDQRLKWTDVDSAFKSRIQTGAIINLLHKDSKNFLLDAANIVIRRITSAIRKQNSSVKVNATFCGLFSKYTSAGEIFDLKFVNTKNFTVTENDFNIMHLYKNNIVDSILRKTDDMKTHSSGWKLHKIINLEIAINECSYYGFSGSSYIELPREIEKRKACINVKNSDDACFAWAVVSALLPARKHSDRTSSYPHYNSVLKLKGIQFPMTVNQIPHFEKLNSISINLFTFYRRKNGFDIETCYITKNKNEQHVNLLLLQDKYEYRDADEVKYHYVWIKNLSRLLYKQVNKSGQKKYFCDRCLSYFHNEKLLEKHMEYCDGVNDCEIRMPKQHENILKFKNHKYKEPAPFVIYSDLECLLLPTKTGNEYQKHIPSSIGYLVKCSYDDSLSFYRSYRGKDCIDWFIKELQEFSENVETAFLCPLPMDKIASKEKSEYYRAKNCWICDEPFKSDDKKHLDHCHLTGKIRGLAHEDCNINYKDDRTIPVIFHNMSGYDAHFIIKEIASKVAGNVDLLPINKERYISFTKHIEDSFIKFRFIDSFRFLNCSLADLADNLTEFPILREFINSEGRMSDEDAYESTSRSSMCEESFKLLTRKGVYPYDHFDSWDRFNETQVPPIEAFYNKLYKKGIDMEDYEHVQSVWESFGCKNLGDYSDLYLKTDVLLLADVLEKFRSTSRTAYGLDPAHYFTLPGYTWDCMLKFTDIKLELLTDVDMFLFVERGIRGGLSQCTKKYAKANNKYMRGFDHKKYSSYIAYFDINNQYGWAMSHYLPYTGFRWMSDEDISDFDVSSISNESDEGYILEVDLEYPKELHDSHRDLPFCPEHRSPPGSKEKKLMATLHNKQKYVIHYMTLKQALHHGLKLKKIHKILKFKQAPWLKGYIDLNTKFRSQAKNEFEKNLFKLMVNAVFGKTMENVRKRSIVKLKTKWEGRFGAGALIASPFFKRATIFKDESNLAIIEMRRKEVVFNKPIYVGMAVLDISKISIYSFHYDFMLPKFGTNCEICYTDTDSLVYCIKHTDIYGVIKLNCHEKFDTSDYSANNQWGIPQVNKKVLGMMKDEYNGAIIEQFIGLRSKMYAIDVPTAEKPSVKKAKGIKKQVVKSEITFRNYIECLQNYTNIIIDSSIPMSSKTQLIVEQRLIRSKKHQVTSIMQDKVALSPYDDKRYLVSNSFDTLPWGHYLVPTNDAVLPDISLPAT